MRDLKSLMPGLCLTLVAVSGGCAQDVERATGLDPAVAESEIREVAEVILNENFAANRIDPFVPHIAEEVTVFGPGGGPRRDGGEKMIEDLRRAAATKVTHRWEERDWRIQVYGDIGIVTFIYDHDSTRNGVRSERTSRATYVFHRRAGRWVLVHDHTSALREDPSPEKSDQS